MMPDYRRDNPYQQLLADAIKAAGCGVEFPNGYRRVLPIYRAVARIGRRRCCICIGPGRT